MSKYRAFELDDLQADRSKSYAEFLRRPGISMGVYHLPAGGKDLQHPHASDEVYVVLRGRGGLRVRDQEQDVRQGSVISVDHGEEHRFVDITEDLHILVIFAPPDDPD